MNEYKDFYGRELQVGDIVSYGIVRGEYLSSDKKLGVIVEFLPEDSKGIIKVKVKHEISMLKDYPSCLDFYISDKKSRKIYIKHLVKIDKNVLIDHITLNNLPYDLFEHLLNYKKEG